MPLENNIEVTQALHLQDYFRMEQKGGHFLAMDLSGIEWSELTEAQRRKVWALIYNNHHSNNPELIKMLWGLGAKAE